MVAEYEGFNDVSEMLVGRSDMSASVFADDDHRIYLVGGCVADQLCSGEDDAWCSCTEITNACSYYTPKTDTWSLCPDAPNQRYRHAAVAFGEKLYLFGGRDVMDNVVQAVDVFDLASETWSTPYTWVNASSDNVAFAQAGEDASGIYLTAGYSAFYEDVGQVLRVDVETWEIDDSFPPMPTARGDAMSHSLTVDGEVLHFVIGGYTGASDLCEPLKTVESFSIESKEWKQHTDLLFGRADMGLGVIAGKLFVIGGETKSIASDCITSIPVPDVERFEPGSNNGAGAWTETVGIPESRFRFVGSSFEDKIYLFGGQGTHTQDLSGDSSGYPIHNTTMVYTFKDDHTLYSAAGVAALQYTALAVVCALNVIWLV